MATSSCRLAMVGLFLLGQQPQNTAQRNLKPGRAIGRLVTDLVKRLLEAEQIDQILCLERIARIGWAAVDRLPVSGQEAVRDSLLPKLRPWLQRVQGPGLQGRAVEQGRPGRVIERSQHAADVSEGQMLGPALGQR